MARALRVGLIGAGGIARIAHLPGWKAIPQAEVVAVADIDRKAAREAAEAFGIPRVHADYRDLLAEEDIDIVDICAPNRVHAPATIAALRAGKHVLCEKPLGITPKEVEAMIRARRRARRKLMCAQHQRFRPEAQAAKRFAASGALGRVYFARALAIRRNLLPPSPGFIRKALSGGGPCLDIGVHILDLTLWLMGFRRAVSVSGVAQTQLAKSRTMPGYWGDWNRRQFDVEDFAVGFVRLEGGATLTLEASWLSHIGAREEFSCLILGTKAGLEWPSCEVHTAVDRTLVDSKLLAPEDKTRAYTREIEAFADCLLHDRAVPVPAEESLEVIRILDAIYRSQRLGREVKL